MSAGSKVFATHQIPTNVDVMMYGSNVTSAWRSRLEELPLTCHLVALKFGSWNFLCLYLRICVSIALSFHHSTFFSYNGFLSLLYGLCSLRFFQKVALLLFTILFIASSSPHSGDFMVLLLFSYKHMYFSYIHIFFLIISIVVANTSIYKELRLVQFQICLL